MLSCYKFKPHNHQVEVNETYRFQSKTEAEYAVSFLEASSMSDLLDDLPVISNAIFMQVDETKPGKHNGFDASIGLTITEIVKDYIHNIGWQTIFIFNCFAEDGKQVKRHIKFDRWFNEYCPALEFEKTDQDILEPSSTEDGVYLESFMSILYHKNHPQKTSIMRELILLRNNLDVGKTRY